MALIGPHNTSSADKFINVSQYKGYFRVITGMVVFQMGASVVVKVWDGHFTPEELPQEFKVI